MRFAATALVLLLPTVLAGAPADLTIGEYRVTIDSSDTDIFRLYRSGVLVKEIDDFTRLTIGAPLEHASPAMLPDTDINADGVPDLLLFGWSGGAHCCFVTWVYSLGAELELLAEIVGEHTEVEIRQADDDPALEFAVRDWALAYWPFSFGGSPSVEVVLDWQGMALQPSARLTAEAIRLPDDLDALARQYATDPSWSDTAYDPICGLFATAQKLVYAGEPDRAAQFIADSWGGDRAAMVRMSVEFGRRLAGSRYLGIIERQRGAAGNGTR